MAVSDCVDYEVTHKCKNYSEPDVTFADYFSYGGTDNGVR